MKYIGLPFSSSRISVFPFWGVFWVGQEV